MRAHPSVKTPLHMYSHLSYCGCYDFKISMGQGAGRENTTQFIPYNSVVSIGNMGISGKDFESRNNSIDSANFSSIDWDP